MILFLVLNLLNYCLLIIPEKIQISSFSNGEKPLENCPCDLTYNTCDRNCECDEKCNLDNYDAYNEYKIPGNHIFKKKYQKLLPMCSDLDKSPITDLYSPLTIGYQILKKGLCLFNKDAVKYEDDDDLHYDDSIDEIIEKLDLDNDIDDFDSLNNEQPKDINDDSSSFDIYDNLEIEFPVMLPDGSCLKNNYIKFLQDKKVICYDKIEEVQNETRNLKNKFNNYYKEYLIESNTYLTYTNNIDDNNYIIKKFLLEFYVKKKNSKNIHILKKKKQISLIYDQKPSDDTYIEVIYEVKFNYDSPYYKTRSGNPGYIKGKPIITNLKANRVFSGVDSEGDCVEKKTYNVNNPFIYYEDDIIENTFTFEDNIIYGCYYNENKTNNKLNNELAIYENLYKNNQNCDENEENLCYKYSRIGYYKMSKDFTIDYIYSSEKNSNSSILSLDILYEAIGAKNNTQNKLLYVKDYDCGSLNDQKHPKYIKVNAFKVKSETEWWHAPGWKISFPKNIMYPFRIGTTSYEEK